MARGDHVLAMEWRHDEAYCKSTSTANDAGVEAREV
jgi:hypothetical protein